MVTQAYVCPNCRTWFEGEGRRPRCPSCGQRVDATAVLDAPPSSFPQTKRPDAGERDFLPFPWRLFITTAAAAVVVGAAVLTLFAFEPRDSFNDRSGGSAQPTPQSSYAISAFAGSGSAGYNFAVDPFGTLSGMDFDADSNLYVAEYLSFGRVRRITPAGEQSVMYVKPAVDADRYNLFNNASDVAVDSSGDVHVVGRTLVRRILADGSVTVSATGLTEGGTIALKDKKTPPHVGDKRSRLVRWGTAEIARDVSPEDIEFDDAGVLYVLDVSVGARLLRVLPDGQIVAIAGGPSNQFADGPGSEARFSFPSGFALDRAGHIYVADTGNGRVRIVTPGGDVSTVITGLRAPSDVAVDTSGAIYVSDVRTVWKIVPLQ